MLYRYFWIHRRMRVRPTLIIDDINAAIKKNKEDEEFIETVSNFQGSVSILYLSSEEDVAVNFFTKNTLFKAKISSISLF